MADEEDATSSVQDADTFIETESPEVIIARIESKSRQVERLLRLLVFLPPSLPRFLLPFVVPHSVPLLLVDGSEKLRETFQRKTGGKEQRTLNFSDWCLRCCCCYYE
jgi:hypothetical protein